MSVKRDSNGTWMATVLGVTRKGFDSPYSATLWAKNVMGRRA
jgi:hypothetical protein